MHTHTEDLYEFFSVQAAQGCQAKLHIYLPESLYPDRTRPAVLILPGGGYEHVSLREAEPVALRFLANGYAAFVLEYSVAPAVYPTALREAAMAMLYIRRNAESFAVDKVAAVGFSAGGHLCGCLGTLFDSAEVKDLGRPSQIRPDALGLCYPVTVSHGRTHAASFQNLCGEDEALKRRLSLESLVRPDMPPVFLWHTRLDASVPCRNSLLLSFALEEADIPFAMHIYHRGPHGLSTADEQAYPAFQVPQISTDIPAWPEAMAEFFREMGLYIKDREGADNE